MTHRRTGNDKRTRNHDGLNTIKQETRTVGHLDASPDLHQVQVSGLLPQLALVLRLYTGFIFLFIQIFF